MCYSEVPKVFFLAVVGTSQAGAVVFRVVHWRTLRCPEGVWVRGGAKPGSDQCQPTPAAWSSHCTSTRADGGGAEAKQPENVRH